VSESKLYSDQLKALLESGSVNISDIKPSDWTEQNMIMQKPFPGPFKYSRTPYMREIIDCLSQSHPARTVAIMKGAQVGGSAGVIYPGVGWIIKNNPGNTLITVGAPDLIEKSMEKLDLMIDSCGLRPYIKPQVQRNRANKSGDTNFKKEFPQGYVSIISANNHKGLRQIDLQTGFFDDFESVKGESKESGSTRKLLEQRFAAYADTCKIFYISTPEREETSNIKPAYLLGDQRKFMIPCPCCNEFIELVWSTLVKDTDNRSAGITWDVDESGTVVSESVGYTCQECGGFFTDKNKHELLNKGFWKPTAKPSKLGYYSYHINSLYAPLGMYDWEHYVNDFLEANPSNQPRNEALYKTFVNVCLGETYEEPGTSVKVDQLQLNIRSYQIGTVPEAQSIKDGNGKIVMLTCAADLGGRVAGVNSDYDDVRLDYEVIAHSETGSTYSITHGSLGTFIANQSWKKKENITREMFSYDVSKPNNVWKKFEEILSASYTLEDGTTMRITASGIDTGFAEDQVFNYIEKSNHLIFGLKGDKEDKYIPMHIEQASFKNSASRPNELYMVRVNNLKDRLMARINFKWDRNAEPKQEQPQGFLNFPEPRDGKYGLENYFSHYAAEHRVVDKKGNFIWAKKTSSSQNHHLDVNIYNTVVRDIYVYRFFKEMKLDVKLASWPRFADLILNGKI
jgi:phage terminase large subunit GpA-like protein